MKIAIIGQSLFASSVYQLLKSNGHTVTAVFTIPDQNGREDPLALSARTDLVPVVKFARWRCKGVMLPEVFEKYKSFGSELNVLAYCSQFIPMEVINHPKHRSICYHPSLLPKHRGASAINWTLISGDKEGGFSIFWCDDGLDTGPILLQKSCCINPEDTVDSFYMRFLFPEGVRSLAEAVDLIEKGTAPMIAQPEEGASYDAMLNKKELYRLDLNRLSGKQLHDFIRGCDTVPGAWLKLENREIKLFGSKLWRRKIPSVDVRLIDVDGCPRKAVLHKNGLILFGNDNQPVNVTKLGLENGKVIAAEKYGQTDESMNLGEFSESEKILVEEIRKIWASILNTEIDDSSNFFKLGAGSMDVTRLIESIIDLGQCVDMKLSNENVYMNSDFDEFISFIIARLRKSSDANDLPRLQYDGIEICANRLKIKCPNQLFINNKFIDSSEPNNTFPTINPNDESVICQVQCANEKDVDLAVRAAQEAFEWSEWSTMNARDRGKLLNRLADLLDAHKEELATLESIDSGAVYTLAVKTHIGMSIETWRYFAGWCDKIQGETIPINNARPNRNLTSPEKTYRSMWVNYSMELSSYDAFLENGCLFAAGNTVVLKPAEVTPLTALKFAELSVYAGFPAGVINILPGIGSITGQAINQHPLVRKIGFTGPRRSARLYE
ncbi:Cytosolic 10-formyltetrahydrofolate dehydrogenase [Sarcoptes scabiei]|uniref:Cytosolic 10-formyltetrahydrofolate dehydrogenase n=1 Tax=Sarcoptes scabiei TaxID=52283 RepID=A0A834RDK8_SARSC|nr:Cytosolic 10-formyltetrahydrofolate dehydrogenase [Sarcoptes scabiei]